MNFLMFNNILFCITKMIVIICILLFQQFMQTQQIGPSIPPANVHQMHNKQQKCYQSHDNQTLSPSSMTEQNLSSSSNLTNLMQSSTSQILPQTQSQQSTQCQTDPLDVKPNIQIPSPVKQELPSPIQVQAQNGSSACQVTSPRIVAKGSQNIPSSMNITGNTVKQMASPGNASSTLSCPRQGVKRPSSSPICRPNNNRSEL